MTADGVAPRAAMTSRERQITNGAIYLVPVAVGSVVPMMTLPIITRILTPAEYGAWALAVVYASFATGVANLGLTVAYERNFFDCADVQARATLLYSVLTFVGTTFALVGAASWMFRQTFARWIIGSAGQGDLLFWAYCASVVTSVKTYYLLYFRNTEDARAYAWFSIDETVLTAVFSVAFVAGLRLGPMGLVLGQLTAGGLVLAAVVRKVSGTLRPAFSRSRLSDSLRISLPLTPRIFLGVVGNNFNKYLIGLLATTGGVGVYTVGQRIGYVAFQYMTAIENVFTPQVYRRMFALGGQGGHDIGRYLTPFAYASAGVALLIAMFAEELLIVLTPVQYHGAIPIVALLTVSYGIMFFGKIPQLIFSRKTFVTSVLTIVSLSLTVGFNVLLIPRLGALGAAIGTLAAGILSGAIGFGLRQHYYHIAWQYRRLAGIFGLFVAGALIAATLRGLSVAYWVRLPVKLLFVAAFVWLGARLGYLTRSNFDMVKRLVLSRLGPGTVHTEA